MKRLIPPTSRNTYSRGCRTGERAATNRTWTFLSPRVFARSPTLSTVYLHSINPQHCSHFTCRISHSHLDPACIFLPSIFFSLLLFLHSRRCSTRRREARLASFRVLHCPSLLHHRIFAALAYIHTPYTSIRIQYRPPSSIRLISTCSCSRHCICLVAVLISFCVPTCHKRTPTRRRVLAFAPTVQRSTLTGATQYSYISLHFTSLHLFTSSIPFHPILFLI
ncbi:hypothetical protein DENSPDRAFT_289136 [Dentipellis sp. KUC8613]|nr:hypothetical protein DENSPDRAFT_289136 [Dentipellis sp. KUC8613]